MRGTRAYPSRLARLCGALFAAALLLAVPAQASAAQVRISQMGQDGDPERGAHAAAVAFDPAANRYLAVWAGDDVIDDEYEIYARTLDAQGNPARDQLRLTHMGPDGDPDYAAVTPALTYNPQISEHLLVFTATSDQAGLAEDEYEIYAQRLDASGQPLGEPVRVSEAGGVGDADYAALDPQVTVNTNTGEYLVAWSEDSNESGLVDDEYEIFARRLDSQAQPIGDAVRVSQMGPDADPTYDATYPDLTYDPAADEYMVVWEGDSDKQGQANDATEIFGQRLTAQGQEVGADDFAISDMGASATDTSYDATSPTIAVDPLANEYLVAWSGDDTPPLSDNEEEIFAQRLTAQGDQAGANDLRLSDMGEDGDGHFDASLPAATYNPASGRYLLVWQADDDREPLEDGELEIFAQELDPDGAEVGADDVRISRMGEDADPDYTAQAPAVAAGTTAGSQLVAWSGDDDTPPLADDEHEVYVTTELGLDPSLFGTATLSPLSLAGPDRRSPALTLRAHRKWRLGTRKPLKARLTTDEDCAAKLRLKLALGNRHGHAAKRRTRRAVFTAPVKIALHSHRRATVRLRLAKRTRNFAARHTKSNGRVRATVIATCRDAAQNEAEARWRVTVVANPRKAS